MNRKVVLTFILIIYIILLFLGASVIKLGEVSDSPGFDKALHFIGFFILTILLLLTFEHYKLNNKHIAIFLIALGLGIIIEVVQLGIPGREFSLLDLLVDVVGIILALVLKWSFSRR